MRNQDANDEMDDLIRRSTQVEIRPKWKIACSAGWRSSGPAWNNGRRAAGATGIFPDPPAGGASDGDGRSRPGAVAVGWWSSKGVHCEPCLRAAAQQLRNSQSLEYTIRLQRAALCGSRFQLRRSRIPAGELFWYRGEGRSYRRKQIVLMHLDADVRG